MSGFLVPIYDVTHLLTENTGFDNFFNWFFEEHGVKNDLVVTDITPRAGVTIEVTVNGSGTLSVGTAIIGLSKDLGATIYGAKVGITDFSRKIIDPFGNYTLVERAFSKRADVTVMVQGPSVDVVASKVDEINLLLADFRAKPLVWVGTEQFSSTMIFGFYKSFDLDIAYPTQSALTLSIEGLT